MRKSQQQLLKLILTAMMAALCMVLDRLTPMTANMKLGIAFVPIILVAVVCGPIHATAAWGIADLIGSLVFAKGAPIPGITVVYALMGLVYGLCLYRGRLCWWRVLLPAAVNQFVLALFGTTLFLAFAYYGIQNYWAVLASRILQCVILFALNLLFIPILHRLGVSLRRRMN